MPSKNPWAGHFFDSLQNDLECCKEYAELTLQIDFRSEWKCLHESDGQCVRNEQQNRLMNTFHDERSDKTCIKF